MYEILFKKCYSRFNRMMSGYYESWNHNKRLAICYLNDAYFEFQVYRTLYIDIYGIISYEDDRYSSMLKTLQELCKNENLKFDGSNGVSYFTEK